MAFINEYIPEADYKKYNFDALNARDKEHSGSTPRNDWTIDREADIWLRKFYSEMDHTAYQGGFTGISVWDFYWKGHLMLVKIEDVASGGVGDASRWQRKKLLNINIPLEIENTRQHIITALIAAFTAHRGAGVFANNDDYEYAFTLDI